MSKFTYYNPNPSGLHTGDCAYRGISAFFGITWMASVLELVNHATNNGRVNFTYISNITSYMASKGYIRKKTNKPMTVGEFIDAVTKEGYAYLVSINRPRHITFISPDRELLDIGDCSNCIVQYYWQK